MSLNDFQNADPSQLGNDQELEIQWAMQAAKHAETHFKVLKSMKIKKNFRLTQMDDEVYKHFREVFPNLQLALLTNDTIKEPKADWQNFCMHYEKEDRIKDFNMGTLLRLDSRYPPDENNTCIVPRIMFLAVEIARNREGANDVIIDEPSPSPASSSSSASA